MKSLLPLVLLLLTGCALFRPSESELVDQFADVKSCMQASRGSFYDLDIRWRNWSPYLTCDHYWLGLCAGEFEPPNKIRLAQARLFRHEVVHALLYWNTGDADPGHTSPYFERCS